MPTEPEPQDQTEEEAQAFDLTAYAPEGSYLLGFTGTVKYLAEDGAVAIRTVWHGVPIHEAVGMAISCADDVRNALSAGTELIAWEPEEEEEER